NLGYRNRIVTLDGQVINAGGSFTGGSTARSVGVFSRKQELDELRSKRKKLDEKHGEAEKELAARKAEVDNLSDPLSGAEPDGRTAASERLQASLDLDRLNTAVAQYGETLRTLQAEVETQQQARAASEAEYAAAEAERRKAEEELEQYTAELAQLGESAGSL